MPQVLDTSEATIAASMPRVAEGAAQGTATSAPTTPLATFKSEKHRKGEMLHPFGSPSLGEIKWNQIEAPRISREDHKSKRGQKLKGALHFQSALEPVQQTQDQNSGRDAFSHESAGRAPTRFENEALP